MASKLPFPAILTKTFTGLFISISLEESIASMLTLKLPTAFLKLSGEPVGKFFTLILTLLETTLPISAFLTKAETGSISTFPDFSGKITKVAII